MDRNTKRQAETGAQSRTVGGNFKDVFDGDAFIGHPKFTIRNIMLNVNV
jgi:hypothetical protein